MRPVKIAFVNCEYPPADSPPLIELSCGSYFLHQGVKKKHLLVLNSYLDNHFLESLKGFRPDLVVLFTNSSSFAKASQDAQKIKRALSAKLILAGTHITALPQSLPQAFFTGIYGEPEITLWELYKNYPLSSLRHIRGLIWRHQKTIIQNPPRPLLKNLDLLAPLEYQLLPIHAFQSIVIVKKNRPQIVNGSYLTTSRGCPFNCAFCAKNIISGQTIRAHSAKVVIQTIDQLYNHYHIRYLRLTDSLFPTSTKRLRQIIRGLTKKGLLGKISFGIFTRTDILNEEKCRFLKKLGVIEISFGIESGHPQVLSYLKNKTTTPKINRRALLLAEKYGFQIKTSFIWGSPYETPASCRKTLKFLKWLQKRHNIKSIRPNIAVPFPGTKLWHDFPPQKISWSALNPNRPTSFYQLRHPKAFSKYFRQAQKICQEIDNLNRQLYPQWNQLTQKAHAHFIKNHFKALVGKFLHFPISDQLKILFSPKLFSGQTFSGLLNHQPRQKNLPRGYHAKQLLTKNRKMP